MKISGKRNQTILQNNTIKEPVTISDCVNCKIVNCDFSSNEHAEPMLRLSDCSGCIVSKCNYHDKGTKGAALKIDGSKSKDNIIEDCEWWNLTYSEGNGGEPLGLGDSTVSHLSLNTIVRNCTFRALSADVETISIKSCGNIIERCRHENCKSSMVIRHGHTNTIQDNEFIGEGGIRVYGKGLETANSIKINSHIAFLFAPYRIDAFCTSSVAAIMDFDDKYLIDWVNREIQSITGRAQVRLSVGKQQTVYLLKPHVFSRYPKGNFG